MQNYQAGPELWAAAPRWSYQAPDLGAVAFPGAALAVLVGWLTLVGAVLLIGLRRTQRALSP